MTPKRWNVCTCHLEAPARWADSLREAGDKGMANNRLEIPPRSSPSHPMTVICRTRSAGVFSHSLHPGPHPVISCFPLRDPGDADGYLIGALSARSGETRPSCIAFR